MASSAKMMDAPLPDRLVSGLSKIGLAMKSKTWRRPGRAGVGPLQVQVLTYLRSCPDQAATVSTIARELAVKLPTASEVIRTLSEKRLVRRVQREADHRLVRVYLTPRGAQAGTLKTGWPEMLAAATKELTPHEQASLLAALVKLIKGLQQQGEIPIVRMCPSCQYFRPNGQKSGEALYHCQFFDASFGEESIRLDCPEHAPAAMLHAKRAMGDAVSKPSSSR